MEALYSNFIHNIIDKDIENNIISKVHTRFPPEPNGCLHLGSAKAILINYIAAKKYGGLFNLRYDDTNPEKEDDSFVQSILKDLKWLIGENPSGGVFYGSDYFEKCYEYAVFLIKNEKAFVCDLSSSEISLYRKAPTEKGIESPYRYRSVQENLELFLRMKNGEFKDGQCSLRAKIDMNSPNLNLRDPVIYRISHTHHHRQGDKWCIYPLYDFAHPIQDAIEGITHSLCSLEFKNHRPLYEWVIDNIGLNTNKPHQYEFGRMNVTYTVMSKRYLSKLVENGTVDGWDDPRLPTLSGLCRRGYTPSSIMDFISRSGIASSDSLVDYLLLEHCIREELNASAIRRIAVLDPILVTITNFPENHTEYFSLSNNPVNPDMGSRQVPFTRQIFIDKQDFAEIPPPKFFRLKPDGEVRLAGAYIIKLNEIIKDENGNIKELLCTADLETKNNTPIDGRKIKGTIHWLSKENACDISAADYEPLFTEPNVHNLPEGKTLDDILNPASIKVYKAAKAEMDIKEMPEGTKLQFVRLGFYCKDTKLKNRFNRIVSLKSNFKPE